MTDTGKDSLSVYIRDRETFAARACTECRGIGTCNDGECGDIGYSTWTCTRCGGSGYEPLEGYYIQYTKQFVGNSVLWWRPNRGGYTSDIDQAGIYSAEEARRIERRRDGTDKAWPRSVIDRIISQHVDAQKLPQEQP